MYIGLFPGLSLCLTPVFTCLNHHCCCRFSNSNNNYRYYACCTCSCNRAFVALFVVNSYLTLLSASDVVLLYPATTISYYCVTTTTASTATAATATATTTTTTTTATTTTTTTTTAAAAAITVSASRIVHALTSAPKISFAIPAQK